VCCLHPAKNGGAEPQNQPITYKEGTDRSNLPDHYGSYHLRESYVDKNRKADKAVYKVDDELIGISVIDILPNCISSVYFIWHPGWAWASLGKLSALHEIALSLEMRQAGLERMKYLYMGASIPFLGTWLISRILDIELCQDEI